MILEGEVSLFVKGMEVIYQVLNKRAHGSVWDGLERDTVLALGLLQFSKPSLNY